jgi:hypothetical protein
MVEQYADEQMAGDYEETIAWDEVGSPPDKGVYNFTIEKAEYKPTAAGKHMVKVQYKIEAAVDPNHEKNINRTVFDNWVFTQNAAFKVKEFCKALDIPLPATVNKAVLEDWIAENIMTGITFSGTISHRPYNGQQQADVGKFAPAVEISGGAIDHSGGAGDADAAQDQEPEQEEEVQADADQEFEEAPEEEAPPPPPTRTRSLREAAPAPATRQPTRTNGTANGHTNGHTASRPAARTAAPAPTRQAPPPAKKTAKKTAQARR